MKSKLIYRILAIVMCAALLAACLPFSAFAAEEAVLLSMTEGDVTPGFAPAGTGCVSTDPSVAWVDENGSLNALKEGSAVITVPTESGETEYQVTVNDYSDGSEVVGNLKLLARYNDSMQFYDGHVYLLFTSYQDGVEIAVDDLYAGYEIDPGYYNDIREDISNGSNHTGADAEKYFTFNKELKKVNVDRGEIVTIGMYRDFDLTVPQAALGSIKNSTLWGGLVKEGKSAAIEAIFGLLNTGNISTEEAFARIKAVLDASGLDYNKSLDGVVDGGVCFNRELYNQKLEWDQYENVTYDLDVTRNQLNALTASLGGNLNNFSILKNSCATVALRAWNAAVGTRDGENTAYYLTSSGDGILSFIDAPKGVRGNIENRLPGYYLNNADGVEEPGAGYQDETGWVYVSAPKNVTPAVYNYADEALVIDASKTKPAALVNAAKAGSAISYNKDEQEIGVEIKTTPDGDATAISGIDFTINGETVSLTEANQPEGGIWFKAKVEAPAEGADYYVTDAQGKALASEYSDGWVSFYTESLPATYKIICSEDETRNILKTTVVNGDKVKAVTEVYTKDGGEKTVLDSTAEVAKGATVYVKSVLDDEETTYTLTGIEMNGESIFTGENYDAQEGAYFTVMPERYSKLTVTYEVTELDVKGTLIQVYLGDDLDPADYASLSAGDPNAVEWQVLWDSEEIFAAHDGKLTAVKEGEALLWLCAKGNERIGVPILAEVYDNAENMAAVILDENNSDNLRVYSTFEGKTKNIPFSGYLVKKGSVLTLEPVLNESKAILGVMVNGSLSPVRNEIVVNGDTSVRVSYASAEIRGVPETLSFPTADGSAQISAKVSYTGVLGLLPVYDSTVTYESSDPLVNVDETGLITVNGDIPEDGAAVYVTATAGSSGGSVKAVCKVILGDYKGDRTVGKLTIWARTINQGELVAHGAVSFTTYEDVDLDVSYYEFYDPNSKYDGLMVGYEENPEAYPSDPALYNMNELDLTDRNSYFDVDTCGSASAPKTISLKAGESATVSNYSFDSTNLVTVKLALRNGQIQSSEDVQALIKQMEMYDNGELIDGVKAFDAFFAALGQIYSISSATGHNPADGHSVGGLMVDRELYNQFRRNDSQMPNNYYTVEITADELAALKAYLADPENNYYSIMVKNCGSGAVDAWNATLADRPELKITANLTGLSEDPQSLYFALGRMALNESLDGEGGKDFYPRTVAYSDGTKDAIDKIAAIGEVEFTEECAGRIAEARAAYEALNDGRKDRVWNYDTLVAAEEQYAALQTEQDIAEFNAYKTEMLAAADALAQEGDSFECRSLVLLAKAAISILPYDTDKSLDENKAAVDAVIAKLGAALERQRELEALVYGDADGDGRVTVRDVTAIQRYLAEIDELDEDHQLAADVNLDGRVNIEDVTVIQRWLAEFPVIYPVGRNIF